jgi:hypothetical protein
MAKFMKKLAETTADVSPKAKEFVAADYLFHVVEVTGGKKLEKGTKAECIKAGKGRFGNYLLLNVDGDEVFVNPGQVKVLKAVDAAKAALLKAEVEARAEETHIVGGIIQRETFDRVEDGVEKKGAVLVKHHGWFKALWFPKPFVVILQDHDDGEQVLLEIATWKIRSQIGPRGIQDLDALQEGYQAMITPPAKPEPKAGRSLVTGKTTIIRRK